MTLNAVQGGRAKEPVAMVTLWARQAVAATEIVYRKAAETEQVKTEIPKCYSPVKMPLTPMRP